MIDIEVVHIRGGGDYSAFNNGGSGGLEEV